MCSSLRVGTEEDRDDREMIEGIICNAMTASVERTRTAEPERREREAEDMCVWVLSRVFVIGC
jgi:hypothetical protein